MKIKVCFLLFFITASVTVLAQEGPRINCIDIVNCNADIAILFDKSGSIVNKDEGGYEEAWPLLKRYIYNIIETSDFGGPVDTGALYSVLFFANQAKVWVNFNSCKDLDCIKGIIENVKKPYGETHTALALRTAAETIFTEEKGDRPDVPNIIIMMTDGKPEPYNKTELDAAVAAVKNKNIRIIGIGVGTKVDEPIMRRIVSYPPEDNYFYFTDFEGIRGALSEILNQACIQCTIDCFGDWTPWSLCPVTCGTGTVTRTRRKFEVADVDCDPGETIQTQQCDAGPCEEGPCDPKTIDFYNAAFRTESWSNVNENTFLGSWFSARWYLSPDINISSERYDVSQYMYKKAGYPDNIFINNFGRDKLKQCCDDMIEITAELQRDRSLHWSIGDKLTNPPDARVAVVYSNELFIVLITCYGPKLEEKRCTYYDASFWSRCKNVREQDLYKGVDVLKKLCYPHMRLFVRSKQEMDCHEDPTEKPVECDDDKKDKKDDKHDDDQREMKKKRDDYGDDDRCEGTRNDNDDDDDVDDWDRMGRCRRNGEKRERRRRRSMMYDDDDRCEGRRNDNDDDDDGDRKGRCRRNGENRERRRRRSMMYDDDIY